jgi:hypothetical protein
MKKARTCSGFFFVLFYRILAAQIKKPHRSEVFYKNRLITQSEIKVLGC